MSYVGDENVILSILLVNSNGLHDTLNCLESIFKNPPSTSFEVLCVDNCSKDNAIPILREYFPEVKLYCSPRSQGFSKNYNMGLSHSLGQYLLILNNDTVVYQEALDHLLKFLFNRPDFGMAGPKLVSQDGHIQSACARKLVTPWSYILDQILFDKGAPLGRLRERYRSWNLEKKVSGPVTCISGACMLVTRTAIDKIGLFDESFEFYFEDVEWCHRLQMNGFRIGYVAESVILHLGDHSLSKVREWAKKSEFLSALRYFRQYHGLSKTGAWILWGASVVNFWLRRLIFILRGQSENAKIYYRLLKWILATPPELFKN